MKSVGNIIQKVLQPVFEKKPHLNLMLDWVGIVGQDIAECSWPRKMISQNKNTWIVYLEVLEGKEFFIWSVTGHIIQRVNQYLGYNGVSRIQLSRHYVEKT